MQQIEKQEDYSLDQVINIVNSKPAPYKNSTNFNQDQRPDVIDNSRKLKTENQRLQLKKLFFKPWSGCDGIQSSEEIDVIKQEIQGQEHDNIQNQEQEGEHQYKEYENFDQKTGNIAKHNQIGYFYKFQNGPVKLIKKLLDENGFKYANTNKNWTIYWSSSVIKMQTYKELLPYQKLNHFPNSFHLTRKDLMNKCISKMQIRHGYSNFNFLPKSFILPGELQMLQDEFKKNSSYMYIVKPHNRSQGKGITVTSSLSTIYAKLEKYSSLIVSHYIDNPLLINNLKFDLRIYVAILGVNPLRIYVYKDGLGRFATESYDETNSNSQNKRFQHLTNYSINKKNLEFVKSKNQQDDYFGSKWSLSALRDFLAFNVGKLETDDLFDRIDDLIVKTIISGQNILYTSFINNVPFNNGCFEVLGFDVLIDSNLKPWLIEVNMSPSMNSDSPIDIKIKGNMVADLFTLAGFTPLSERYLDGNQLRYDIKNFIKSENKFIELGPIQKFVLKEIKQQYDRKSGWKRIFPCPTRKYKQFFEIDRYFNRLIREYQPNQDALQNNYQSVNTMPRKTLSRGKGDYMKYNSNKSANHKKNIPSNEKITSKKGISIRIQQKPAKKIYI